MSTVHVGFAHRLTDCRSVIGYFVEYYLKTNSVIVREGRSARVGSVLSETQ